MRCELQEFPNIDTTVVCGYSYRFRIPCLLWFSSTPTPRRPCEQVPTVFTFYVVGEAFCQTGKSVLVCMKVGTVGRWFKEP